MMCHKAAFSSSRPAQVCAAVIFSGLPEARKILLIRRNNTPYRGCFALPSGFVEKGEDPSRAASRELLEETGLTLDGPLELIEVLTRDDADPRGRTECAVYAADTGPHQPYVCGADDAAEAAWFSTGELPAPLAFDHDAAVRAAAERYAQSGLPLRAPVQQDV